MSSKKEFLTELVKNNDLTVEEDIFRIPLKGKQVAIITRTGIEKIQFHNNIKVVYETISIDPSFVVVKAIGTLGDLHSETYGESSPVNLNKGSGKYPVAMAEKRALSRVVLKLSGAYKYGVYGQDESDEFKPSIVKVVKSEDLSKINGEENESKK
jgi:hypothetical protein